MTRHHQKSKGKERMTVSLSRESAQFFRTLRETAQAPSMSALMERIAGDLQSKTAMEQLDAKLRAYYDAMPDRAVEEESAWGALGEAALAAEEDAHQPEMAVTER
jgi:hypothetical protein